MDKEDQLCAALNSIGLDAPASRQDEGAGDVCVERGGGNGGDGGADGVPLSGRAAGLASTTGGASFARSTCVTSRSAPPSHSSDGAQSDSGDSGDNDSDDNDDDTVPLAIRAAQMTVTPIVADTMRAATQHPRLPQAQTAAVTSAASAEAQQAAIGVAAASSQANVSAAASSKSNVSAAIAMLRRAPEASLVDAALSELIEPLSMDDTAASAVSIADATAAAAIAAAAAAPPAPIPLRDYQQKLLVEIQRRFEDAPRRHTHPTRQSAAPPVTSSHEVQSLKVLAYLPTGGGKTRIAAAAMRDVLCRGRRCLFVVNSRVLLEQTRSALIGLGFKSDAVGVVGGKLQAETAASKAETAASASATTADSIPPWISLATIQSLHSRWLNSPTARRTLSDLALIVLDEAHAALASSYRALLAKLPQDGSPPPSPLSSSPPAKLSEGRQPEEPLKSGQASAESAPLTVGGGVGGVGGGVGGPPHITCSASLRLPSARPPTNTSPTFLMSCCSAPRFQISSGAGF